jgi:hypothetical protein
MQRAILLLSVITLRGLAQGPGPRTVTSSEIGSIFATPNGFDWTQVGAYVGAPKSELFSYMIPSAIKVVHTRFHVFKESDEWTWNYFHYSGLRIFEGTEIAAGRAPLFVTAYYKGRTRQVVWNWSLGLQPGSRKPTTPSSAWEYAVNVQDDRFIHYWIQYIGGLLQEYSSLENVWVGVDEAAFMPELYGVIDDDGNFVQGVQWDAPFPQTPTDYYNSIQYFFTRVTQLAPSFKIMPNSGGISDWTQFASTFGKAQGLMLEEINPEESAGDYYVRSLQHNQLIAYSNESSLGYPMIFASLIPASIQSRIVNSYLMYLLVKGANTFYAPAIAGTTNALPPSTYQIIGQTLGQPVGGFRCKPAAQRSADSGLCVYSREFQNGIVFLNWTGSTQNIPLPAGRSYRDPNNHPVSTVALQDLRGIYVLNH